MLSNLFRSADLDSQFACMLKQGRCLYFGSDSTASHVMILRKNPFNVICNLLMLFLYVVANEIPSKALPLVKEQAINSCITILHSYRKFCATVTSTGQLILPEALKLLPLYTLGISLSLLIHLKKKKKITPLIGWFAPCGQGTFYAFVLNQS